MDDDEQEQDSFERLLDIVNRALTYLLIGVLIGKFVAIFTVGAAFEPMVARVAACAALAIITALAIDQAVIRLHSRHANRTDASAS